MLCQFSFSNFRSYRDEITIDFRAENLGDEFSDSLIDGDLLPVCVLYGPNGGGKSNALKAIMCLVSTVLKPIYETKTNRLLRIVPLPVIPCTPFLFEDGASKKPTEFLIVFRIGDYEYRYFISLLDGEVVAESLDRKKLKASRVATLFDRDKGKITLGASLSKKITTNINSKMPFLSFLCINYAIPQIQEVQEWFESCLLRSYADPLSESMLLIAKQDDEHRDFVRILNDCGVNIKDFRFDEDRQDVIIEHQVSDTTYELSINDESDGTQKLFLALPLVQLSLKQGRLLVIDELDAKLHPKLLRYVIAMFTNPEINKHGAQLLFTSHDMSTLKSSVFRRDEILFAALNDEQRSELFCLYQIRDEFNNHVSTKSAYDKQYLEGRYGADPYLQSMLSGGEWQ